MELHVRRHAGNENVSVSFDSCKPGVGQASADGVMVFRVCGVWVLVVAGASM